MMLTETEKIMIKVLSSKDMETSEAAGVMSTLRMKKLERKMLNYLEKNPDTTAKEIKMLTYGLKKIPDGTDL